MGKILCMGCGWPESKDGMCDCDWAIQKFHPEPPDAEEFYRDMELSKAKELVRAGASRLEERKTP